MEEEEGKKTGKLGLRDKEAPELAGFTIQSYIL